MTDPVSNSSNSNGQPQQQENIGMIVDAATTLSSIHNEEQQQTSIVSNEPQQRESEKTSATYDSSDGPVVSDHFDGEEHVATTATDKESLPAKDAAAAESTEALSEPISLNDDAEQQKTRFLPENKKPDAAPTFPEKLMKMMKWASAEGLTSVEWVDDGKAFVINQPDSFTKEVVPRFFKATKFSSFTRKLYRWGFRQVNRGIGPDDPIIFGNDSFQRDHEELICKMKSVTAASARKQDVKPMLPVYMEQQQQQQFAGVKHEMMDIGGGGMSMDDQTAKRMMLSQLYQQKAGMLAQQHSNPSMYGLMNAHGQLSLTNALRPANIGGYSNQQQQQQQQPQGLMHMQQPMNHNQQQQHIMSMHASTADNVHQQLLQLHHMQMLGQDSGMQQQQLGDANDLEQHFQQQQQTYQLALQQMQQQQQQPNMSMQAPYPQLAMSSFQPAMNDGGNNSNMQQQQQCNNMGNNGGGNILYDYIPQNAYGNPGSTVEIVNAAISALRYAN